MKGDQNNEEKRSSIEEINRRKKMFTDAAWKIGRTMKPETVLSDKNFKTDDVSAEEIRKNMIEKRIDAMTDRVSFNIINKNVKQGTRDTMLQEAMTDKFNRNKIGENYINVKRFDDKQKELCHLTWDKDKQILVTSDGKEASTKLGSFKDIEERQAIVVDKKGEIYVANHYYGQEEDAIFKHSSILHGKEALYAGSVEINGGKILYIDNNTGHYGSEAIDLCRFINQMRYENKKIFFKDCIASVNFLTDTEVEVLKSFGRIGFIKCDSLNNKSLHLKISEYHYIMNSTASKDSKETPYSVLRAKRRARIARDFHPNLRIIWAKFNKFKDTPSEKLVITYGNLDKKLDEFFNGNTVISDIVTNFESVIQDHVYDILKLPSSRITHFVDKLLTPGTYDKDDVKKQMEELIVNSVREYETSQLERKNVKISSEESLQNSKSSSQENGVLLTTIDDKGSGNVNEDKSASTKDLTGSDAKSKNKVKLIDNYDDILIKKRQRYQSKKHPKIAIRYQFKGDSGRGCGGCSIF